MRNDLMQQGRDGDHRALGLEPETARGLQVLDRPHRSLPHCPAAKAIPPPATPEQRPRSKRFRDNRPRRSLLLNSQSCGGKLFMSRHEVSEPQRRDWRMLTYG